MRIRGLALGAAAAMALTALSFGSGAGAGPIGGGELSVTAVRAPVAPDGLTAGAMTDFVVTFRDLDPDVPGIRLLEGGTIRIELPAGFENGGDPVVGTGGLPGCAPPVVSGCSTAVILQGWPQSPVVPFPDVSWEAATNTFVVTSNVDTATLPTPGPKQVHLIALGFTNPTRPGTYRIGVTIEPGDGSILSGVGHVRIQTRTTASINPNSQANPGPPFPNTLFQQLSPGDTSLNLAFYLWDDDAVPLVGADVDMNSPRSGRIRDGSGKVIGTVRIDAPRDAAQFELVSAGPSTLANAFVTGVPVGRWTAALVTDPQAVGTYHVTARLHGGSEVRHVITTSN